LMER